MVRAVVVLRDGYEPSDALAGELQEHVKRTTAPYKYPRIVEFAPELPKTPSGKVRRAALRAAGARSALCDDRVDLDKRAARQGRHADRDARRRIVIEETRRRPR